MSEHLLTEDLFPLSKGPSKVRKSYNSLYNYIKTGRMSRCGVVVRLEWCLLEGGMATSVEAMQRFRRRLNDVKEDKKPGRKAMPALRMQPAEKGR